MPALPGFDTLKSDPRLRTGRDLEYYDDLMLRLGLCSGACLSLAVDEVIGLAKTSRLEAMEWAADAHVRPGDSKLAERVMMATLRADMTISSYASIYRACSEEHDIPKFKALLATASAMYAPNLRIYAPAATMARTGLLGRGREEVVAGELRRLGDEAASRGVTVCLSLGKNTMLDGYSAALSLVSRTDHPFVRLAWEDLPASPDAEATKAVEEAESKAALLIARCVDRDGAAIGIDGRFAEWRKRIAAFKRAERDPKMGSFILIGSARDAAGLTSEVSALRALIDEIEGSAT